jgi:peptidoglycan/LPS O-acetylase OafA/YrhL
MKERPYIDSLTGLRGIAALWVALLHGVHELSLESIMPNPLLNSISCGWLAVDLFFVLSGFVIAYVHLGDFTRITKATCVRFLLLRLARIYPAHLAAVLLWLAPLSLAAWQSVAPASAGLSRNYSWLTFTAAVTLTNGWGIPGFMGWNLPSWSVGSEWFAYLTFPLLGCALCRVARAAYAGAIIAATLLLMLCLSHWLTGGARFVLPDRWALVRVECEFLIGCCVYLLAATRRASILGAVLTYSAAAAVVAMSMAGWQSNSGVLYLMCFAALVFGLANSPTGPSRFLTLWPLQRLGRISYSLYLIHALVIVGIRTLAHLPPLARLPEPAGTWVRLALYLVSIGVAAQMLYALVEKPGRIALRRRWGLDGAQPSAALAA